MFRLEKVKKSYQFFCNKEKTQELFTMSDVQATTGWTKNTVSAYQTKKWSTFLQKSGKKYYIKGITNYTEEEYIKLMSQVYKGNNDIKRPQLSTEIEELVLKAKESAILALDIYNRPSHIFRTEGFIVLMIIAWTALFHAIFEKRRIPYIYINPDGTPRLTEDGDEKAWELSKCIKKYYGSSDNPIHKNIEFMISLRNKIEHRYVPAIDPDVTGECQALLLNFDELLVREFTEYYALREHLCFPLQTANMRSTYQIEVCKRVQGKNYEKIKNYIDVFRSGLSDTIYQDPKYSFRVYLIPKIANHSNSADTTFEFIKYDPTNTEELKNISKQIALIRDREKLVPVINPGMFKPGEVAKKV
ncbi:MAG: DUF3644 domain-containing protein [Candidatus Eremiobacterota bacterium]